MLPGMRWGGLLRRRRGEVDECGVCGQGAALNLVAGSELMINDDEKNESASFQYITSSDWR